MKLRLAAECNLKPFTWDTFCAEVVDNPEETMSSYGLDHSVTIFNRKEVQYLLTLDALTLLLVLTRHVDGSSILVNILATDTQAMDSLSLLKMPSSNMPFIGLSDDLFLLENQVPMAFLTKVMNKCAEILNDQKKRSLRKREIPDPFSPEQLLDSSLKAIAKQMCISVFIGPTNDKKKFEASIEAKFLEGELEKCAHIFSCAYRILCTPTTSVVEQPVSKQPPQTVGRLFTNNCLRCSDSTARMQPNHILSVPQSLEPIRSLIIRQNDLPTKG
jgi:hypothetical protein